MGLPLAMRALLDAPVLVVTGHYGVGKTNLSLNLAFDAAARGRQVTVVDLDVVNPFFRSSDYRDLTAAAREGNYRAQLALNMFSYACKKYVGSYMAALGGLDVIVFTAGVGENTPHIRASILKDMEFFGIEIDEAKNNYKNDGAIHEISKDG